MKVLEVNGVMNMSIVQRKIIDDGLRQVAHKGDSMSHRKGGGGWKAGRLSPPSPHRWHRRSYLGVPISEKIAFTWFSWISGFQGCHVGCRYFRLGVQAGDDSPDQA